MVWWHVLGHSAVVASVLQNFPMNFSSVISAVSRATSPGQPTPAAKQHRQHRQANQPTQTGWRLVRGEGIMFGEVEQVGRHSEASFGVSYVNGVMVIVGLVKGLSPPPQLTLCAWPSVCFLRSKARHRRPDYTFCITTTKHCEFLETNKNCMPRAV